MIERATFREKMRSSIDDQPTTPVRRVYDAAVSSVSRQGGGDRPPRIEAFSSFRTILNRARSKRMPEIPRGVEEVEIQGPWRPQKVVCDFEMALITALQSELPQVSIQGCYFHFTQSLWRRVQELGLVRAYRENLRLRKCIRKLMALGYLPRPLVRLNFNSLRRSQRTIRLIDRNPSLLDFFGYVQNTYIGGFFPVPLWNVFDREMDTRTNNHVESYHKTLNDTIGVRHPSLWTFIRCLKDRQTVVEQTIDGAERGELAPARRRKWRVLEERLR
uniref:MULE transposase domain-containing protein n=1 Tax=Knipowitschia caucasica TaxID=637954 RepID=A0AAV2J3Z3_KNICA